MCIVTRLTPLRRPARARLPAFDQHMTLPAAASDVMADYWAEGKRK